LECAVRPADARNLGTRRVAEAEVHDWRRDHLLLRVESRAQLDLPADPERVDPLIPGHRRRARAQGLPVISLGARDARDGWLTIRQADRFKSPIAVQIGQAAHVELKRGIDRDVFALGCPQQDARAASRRDDGIGRPVVVEIAEQQPRRPGLQIRQAVDAANRVGMPGAVGSTARQTRERSVARQNEQIEDRIAVQLRGRDGNGLPGGERQRLTLESACPLVQQDVNGAGGVDERRIRHPFAIEVGPGEVARVRNRRERIAHSEGAVTVVSQQER
jgi:hypothetical protein